VPDEESDEPNRVTHCYMALSVVFDGLILSISLPLVLFTWYSSVDSAHHGSPCKPILKSVKSIYPVQHCVQWHKFFFRLDKFCSWVKLFVCI